MESISLITEKIVNWLRHFKAENGTLNVPEEDIARAQRCNL